MESSLLLLADYDILLPFFMSFVLCPNEHVPIHVLDPQVWAPNSAKVIWGGAQIPT
jgi:hypothetical protein